MTNLLSAVSIVLMAAGALSILVGLYVIRLERAAKGRIGAGIGEEAPRSEPPPGR